MLLSRLRWPAKRVILVVDNLYAKGKLAFLELTQPITMVSRLRNNAALYESLVPKDELPQKPKRPKPGRPRLRGEKVAAKQLYRRRSKHQKLKVDSYGKSISINAFVDILMPR
nr:transposase [Deinococcota bacterium]